MSLDDLEQALFEAKWGDAEEDVTEVIARILELPREAVERVLFAADVVQGDVSKQLMNKYPSLDEELKKALRLVVQEGLARVIVRDCILNERVMMAPPQLLIKDPTEICSGCGISLDCIAHNFSTPQLCYIAGPPVGVRRDNNGFYQLTRLRKGAALVTPVKIRKDTVTVTCTHPRGTFKVAAKDLTT
jgi:hypothetical protein